MKPLSIKNYEFGSFLLDTQGQSLVQGYEQIQLQPKAFEVLLHLVQNAGHTVSRDELITEIWGLSISEGVLSFQISQIRKLLGDVPAHPQYIKTIPKRGFQFIAPVKEVTHTVKRPIPEPTAHVEMPPTPLVPPQPRFEPGISKLAPAPCSGRAGEEEQKVITAYAPEGESRRPESQRLNRTTHRLNADSSSAQPLAAADVVRPFGPPARRDWLFGGHLWHVLIACVLYAGLSAVTLLMEVAYQFDSYGRAGIRALPIVYLWTLATSMIALMVVWKRASKGKRHGSIICLLIFLGAAAVLYAGVCRFLPSSSITELTHQPYTAQAAYLKDICYSLLLVIIFLIPTFNFITTMQQELRTGRHGNALELLMGEKAAIAPSGTIFPSFGMLALILMTMAAFSVYLTANLLDHLSPGPYQNLFVNLVYLRLILYYGFGLKCLGWYYLALNHLKRQSRAVANSCE